MLTIKTKFYTVRFDDATNSLVSLTNGKKEFIHPAGGPLFKMGLRRYRAELTEVDSLTAAGYASKLTEDAEAITAALDYKNVGGLELDVRLTARCSKTEPRIYWNISANNRTGLLIEWLTYPYVAVPNDLLATGGSGRLLWPAMEGVLIEDAEKRANGGLRYRPLNYPNRGWEGYYPGPAQTQFMAYYSDEGGLYVGAHDPDSNTKSIEFFKDNGGLRLEFKMYAEGAGEGVYEPGFETVMALFEGDWHDAADIYRDWITQAKRDKLVPLRENPRIPEWVGESPVVMAYPVRGTKDMGDMTPNEYFPYKNMLPYMKSYSERFGSKVMALLMHWEGTAPWAPPYVWPPYGGEEIFRELVEGAHASGNLVGVYCSGMGWTNESNTDTSYTRRKQFEEQNLATVMCAAPDGSTPNSKICNGPHGQRYGHDMCPANEFVKTTVADEVRKVLDSGVDYAQYFDQNLGGASYLCYSDTHGHAPSPGKWQAAEVRKLLERIAGLLEERGSKALIGCEAAAAEPYLEYLYFNDLRSSINLMIGKPVPLYAYLFHEYTSNFMGNQNGLVNAIDLLATPDNLLFRLAYAFISGDLLTVVIKGKGEIHWDWGTRWDVEAPEQEPAVALVKHLNAWRTGRAKNHLFGGRMQKPFAVESDGSFTLVKSPSVGGGDIIYPAVMTSMWRSPAAQGAVTAQILVNVSREAKPFTINIPDGAFKSYKLYTDPTAGDAAAQKINGGSISGSVPALSAVMIEYI